MIRREGISPMQQEIDRLNVANRAIFDAVLDAQLPRNPALRDKPLGTIALEITKVSQHERFTHQTELLQIEPIVSDSNGIITPHQIRRSDAHMLSGASSTDLKFSYTRYREGELDCYFDSTNPPKKNPVTGGGLPKRSAQGLRAASIFIPHLKVHYEGPENIVLNPSLFPEGEITESVSIKHFVHTPVNGREGKHWLEHHLHFLETQLTHAADSLLYIQSNPRNPVDVLPVNATSNALSDFRGLIQKRQETQDYLGRAA